MAAQQKNVVELGDRVRDRITGYEGIAVGCSEWINKCMRFAVQKEKLNKENKVDDAVWFDVEQLEVVKKGIIVVDKTVPPMQRPNGPHRTPPTRNGIRG